MAQAIASIMAALTLMLVFPSSGLPDASLWDIPASVVIKAHASASFMNTFFMELILTFILIYVVFACAFDCVDNQTVHVNEDGSEESLGHGLTIYTTTGDTKAGFAPMAIGFVIGALTFVGSSVSGNLNLEFRRSF